MAKEGDVVLIHYQDKPAVFARVESIEPDFKKDWYHVTLLLLTLPMQTVTWILRDAYINGDVFTMGGVPMRLDPVKAPPAAVAPPSEEKESPAASGRGGKLRVIPFKKPE
ncbi:MAG TPA: hypothetical protein ENN79_15310 [Desulfobacteraceae bacterium]|nr:hypothetical protein [Desulfobacteraceae bacterium]